MARRGYTENSTEKGKENIKSGNNIDAVYGEVSGGGQRDGGNNDG